MIEDFLDHTCNIYHLQKGRDSPGYNLPESSSFSYSDAPDIAGQMCHFGVRSQSVSITQSEPMNIMEARIKLTLPIGTDIRINDKIVDCTTGMEYTAEQPRNIRNHHMFVYIKRIEVQKPL